MRFVFISQPDFGCNPYALWKYMKENTSHETVWLVRERYVYMGLQKRGIACALYDTAKGNDFLASADFVITNATAHYAYLPKNKKARFVCLWHGSGIKSHDYFNPNLPEQQIKILDDFNSKTDLLCVHSLDDKFRLSSLLHFDMRKCVVTGQPRLDNVVASEGKRILSRLFSSDFSRYDKVFFFAPSVRANTFMSAGKLFADNIFRLEDYSDTELFDFLTSNNAAIVYKFHPAEQKSFANMSFILNEHCYQISDKMLFESDVRYTDILNAFDVLITDYSTIAFDFLLLDRPIVYLVPDYEKYAKGQGFVFHNIEDYMPGKKAKSFAELLFALKESIFAPKLYSEQRAFVIRQRFDYTDGKSAKRVYDAILNYMPLPQYESIAYKRLLPSNAEHLKKHLTDMLVIDSTKSVCDIEKNKILCENTNQVLYITEEIPDEFHSICGISATDIKDCEFFNDVKALPNVRICLTTGGVDYGLFASCRQRLKNDKITIGYAGIIDNRIYIAMVQYIADAFPDVDILFAGDIIGEFPSWLGLYPNIKYVGALQYEDMPQFISKLDVALLPFYGTYNERIPSELFQYLACGKMVVASNMCNLPDCSAIIKSANITDAISNIYTALQTKDEIVRIQAAKCVAKRFDWSCIALDLFKPLVSIILPTYNGSKYIRQSIESCLCQTYDNIELIIVDDCSTDDTPKIIREFAHSDKRVRLIQNSENRKLPASLNIGHQYARGNYITWTSDDNFYYPSAIQEMISHMLTLHADIVFANMDIVDKDGKLDGERYYGGHYRTGPSDELPLKNPIGACFLYTENVYQVVNGYNEDLFCTEDWDFWLKCYNADFSFEHLDKTLYTYRYHEKNLTAQNKERIISQAVDLRLENLKAHSDTISNVMKMRIYLLMAGDAKKIDDKDSAIKWYKKALEISSDAVKFTRPHLIYYVTEE